MTKKQLSLFIENKGGTLIKVLEVLSKAGIQIIASTIADTKDYGIYRVICDKPEDAFLILKEEGVNLQLTDVNAVAVEDKAGAAADVLRKLTDDGVNIAYMYSYLEGGKGMLIYKTK